VAQYNGTNHATWCKKPSVGLDGDQYVCPEYIRRFYRVAKNTDTSGSVWYSANGSDFFPRAAALGLAGNPNCITGAAPGQAWNGCASNTLPQADDIISFCRLSQGALNQCDPTDPGHVAIVKSNPTVTGGAFTLTLIEQNWSKYPNGTPQNPALSGIRNADGTYRYLIGKEPANPRPPIA
jgi:hypothetical protein